MPISKANSRSHAAYNEIKRRILAGVFTPADRLRETEVASLLSMGRTPVREALKRIQDEGLITHQPGRSETAGLRITTAASPEPAFEVTAAEQAEPGDQVVEQGQATVYLDAQAAELLDDKVLDAAVDSDGRVEFALGLQA